MTTNSPDISVVVPLFNEEESLPELTAWIARVARDHALTCEVIFVDDGSTDGSWSVIEQLRREHPFVRAIGFARNYGKSAALYCGFEAAQGEVVVTMDADLQDSPDEIRGGRRSATTPSASVGPASSSTGRPAWRRASGSTTSTAG